VLLANDEVQALVETVGGMMPEFGLRRGRGVLNAHWLPDFRDNSGAPFTADRHGAYWKAKLLYLIAGDFPCSPSFGPGCVVDGIELPPHGWTANEEWTVEGLGVEEGSGAAWARFSLRSPAPAMPLAWSRCDLVLPGQPAYFTVMRIANGGGEAAQAINVARHNTLGAPFLQAGCRIHLCAERFLAAPSGTEFDDTGRLVPGAEFSSLATAPLRSGGTVDLGIVPGMVGWTDFVTGAVPPRLALGWSCVVNPELRLAYVCFFPGRAALPAGEIALGFNDLWLQYGGRPFTPWALHEGGADRSFCLGTENAVGAFANGLAYARAVPNILDTPTTVEIPAGGQRTLCYGTALVGLDEALVREGVVAIEAEQGALVLKGARASQRVPVSADFGAVRALCARLERR
jgi:hypothetical protein